jgi:endonuclease/exonuclease/phosphatase family metal-dependent hydrolase
MIRSCLFLFVMVLASLSNAQISISSTTTPHTQNFNTLRSTSGSSSTLPSGWRLVESGSAANSRYTVDAGSTTTGDTYSYGAVNNTERALGSLQSSNLIPVLGAQFRNTTGRTITSLIISYAGEQWRCGTTGRGADRLDFQYSLNASSLTSGTWIDNNTLDFNSVNVTSVGARNGNLAGNRSVRSASITGLSIANNAIFWIRWTDFDASGADDGLAIDDFSIQLSASDITPPVISTLNPANNATGVALNSPLSITFNEAVQKGSGNIVVRDFTSGTPLQTIDVNTAAVSISGSTSNFTTNLPYNQKVYVEIPAGAFRDLAGNNFAGISGSGIWSFTTIPPPTPTLSVNPASLDFGYIPSGNISPSLSFGFNTTNVISDLTLSVSAPFSLSKDGSSFASQIIFTAPEVQSAKTVFVRCSPTASGLSFSNIITFQTGTWSDNKVSLSANSIVPAPVLDTLKIVNWNIEWFGGSLGPADDNLQQQNVQTVLTNINADIYAIQEVVSASRLQTVVNQMPGYAMIIGDYFCSNGTQASSCVSAQKLAYIYKTSKVTPTKSYPVLRNGSTNASYNWSSGRFPFLMEADVTLNGATRRMVLVNVHAKANTSDFIISYNRRKAGALELRDSLNVQYGTSNVIVLGDLNDDLDKTITTQIAPDTTTSWIDFKSDVANFSLPSLPLSLARIPSTASYPDIIDHAIISNELNSAYVSGSARILRSQVESWIPSYSTTTSDHYPLETRFIWSGSVTGRKKSFTESVQKSNISWTVTNNQIRLIFNNQKDEVGYARIVDMNGRLLFTQTLTLSKGANQQLINFRLPTEGIYMIQLTRGNQSEVIKIVK